MKGKIVLEADENNLGISMNMSHVSIAEKMILVTTLVHSLEMGHAERLTLVSLLLDDRMGKEIDQRSVCMKFPEGMRHDAE